jgi:uracil-DNA glycosylase family 4
MIDVTTICNCKECPFAKDGRPPHIPVMGENAQQGPSLPASATIAVLVGEGPGENETREGRPFVGMTGKELDWKLANVKLPRHKLTILNATACKPPPGKTDQMLGRAAKCCKPLFDLQYAAHKDKPTLAMGKWAAWAVTGKASGVEHSRGFIRGNVIVTYHPTYAFFKNPWVKGDFELDLIRFKRLIDGNLQTEPRVVCEPTIGDMHTLLASIRENNNTVAVDIETAPEAGDLDGSTGKDPTRAQLKTIAFGTDKYACAFTWPVANGRWDIVSAILTDPSICKVFHNGHYFDLRVMARYGIVVCNIGDTREMRRALSATSGLSLRYLAQTYVDFPPWKELEDDK